jgi:3-phosphoshikimate 1-carboxyvinyltransferase
MQIYSPSPLHIPPAARVTVPGSKSHTNRALLVAALADGKTTLKNALFSDDSKYFAQALSDLGFTVTLDEAAKTITVQGLGGKISATKADLFIGNAGTAARFLTALLTLGHGAYRLDGVARMRRRPIGDLVIALDKLGAQINGETLDIDDPRMICPPVMVTSAGLPGGVTSIRGDLSSQFLSGLLMVAPYAQKEVEIKVDGPLHSKPYIDLTLGVMEDFGVEVWRADYEYFRIFPQHYLTPGDYAIESDASAASYFFAAPAICGGWVEVANLSRSARQGDIAFLDVVEQMGCRVTEVRGAIRIVGPEVLHGVDVDMSDISDTSMTLAVIAPFADTPTTIRGIASSRVKETDRVAATVTELRRLGVKVDEHPDGMTIYPCQEIRPARIRTYDDHRMAMAFALVGLKVPGIEIENPDCVAKTFPDYFEVLERLNK